MGRVFKRLLSKFICRRLDHAEAASTSIERMALFEQVSFVTSMRELKDLGIESSWLLSIKSCGGGGGRASKRNERVSGWWR